MSSSSTSNGKQGNEDSDVSSSSSIPTGRRICFLVGTGGGIVAVKLLVLLVGVTNVMFDMVEGENFDESANCLASDCIEWKDVFVLVIITLLQ